ncbi:RluA family pseudouridine synthase [Sphingobacterium paludis]|uniref:tRNA pseudouridine32 synthase / 23S rRNA pseudouridine746 synthase n=1 Tax=Sphingobacterium paludis TaxID=1476465 RepID=A0A4V3E151_9SPHI|nr:RluA family pseudouridine synthase [Sphingobacterium paludis]TDS11918.1 tRNA pseudouridine32 synthase / 23S rRNA pseudouridine746 synthase [Sphingobacterium paludis]
MSYKNIPFLHSFQSDVTHIQKPTRFTFPFSYEPHPLSQLAARELQNYLEVQQDFSHNFGLREMDGLVIGKMFGVLVVEMEHGDLGYIAAVSGKLANSNQHEFFVPPVFDMLTKDSFFLMEEEQINFLNRRIETLTSDDTLPQLQAELNALQQQAQTALAAFRQHMKKEKTGRKEKRIQYKASLSAEAYQILEEDLIKQSYRDQHEYDVLKLHWKDTIDATQQLFQQRRNAIDELKNERKIRSAALQRRLFDQYRFLNASGEARSVLDIFAATKQLIPPAGAGECAAPKLLQYAYKNKLKPICMAEFWWGASPASEVRKHKNYYPACKSKCEPILAHMLQGLSVDNNPLLDNPARGQQFDIIFQDDDIIVVNKPAEFLSVPGIHIQDSVYTRILEMMPAISGPVIIHRLDMSTSGILVLAKNKEAHKIIQDQFIRHTIVKRYTALLDGLIPIGSGEIDLPLRVDLDDRPRQMVCYEHGKPAQTKYTVIGHEQGKTRIHFYPLTGRTHQLRVHAAHSLGLHTAIVGDDLYGKRDKRLHLHAGFIQFEHPRTAETVTFDIPDPF